jgi:4-amino-4-deoxy-L-arabinose transferase-like glycosyltransferase
MTTPVLASASGMESRPWYRYATGWGAALAIVVLYWLMATSAWQTKCTTFDERENITAGLGYWHYGDPRLIGDGCFLPKILPAWPITLGKYNYPEENSPNWLVVQARELSNDTFYKLGNDPARMLYLARGSMALVTALVGLIIYGWSRRLFGRGGAIISVLLFAFCPLMLSHGALATSDVLGAFFFVTSLLALWVMLQRITWWTMLLSSVSVGLFFITKLTAVTLIPIGLLMAALRVWKGPPLRVEFGRVWEIASRWKQSAIIAGLLVLHIAVAAVIIWRAYDFRFEAFTPHSLSMDPKYQVEFYEGTLWQSFLPKEGITRDILMAFRKHHILPDRYLLGVAGMVGTVELHPAFAAGEYTNTGFWWYFPYSFWVKTPLGLFLILVLAALAVADRWKKQAAEERKPPLLPKLMAWCYPTAPLWIALLVYWAMAMRSNLNIGVRHLLPTFPILYILAGAAAYWIIERRRVCLAALAAGLLWFIAASVIVRPNYLAYFNETVGGPGNAYHCLVDSSLDWGQDLPALKDYLDKNNLNDQTKIPVYLCYFGAGNARYYGIKNADILTGFLPQPEEDPRLFSFRPGVYCISATMLSGCYTLPGGWNRSYENQYAQTVDFWDQYTHWDKYQLSKRFTDQQRKQMGPELLAQMRTYGLGRLLSYLRHRTPDDNINYSILIFQLTGADIDQALGGPPPEMLNTDDLLLH